MQSTTGFAYFVVFASVISLFMSIFFAIEFPVIVPYFERRGTRKAYLTQSLQVLLFMLLAGSIALLTWSAVEPHVIGLPFKALGVLYMVLFFLYAVYAHKDYPMAKSSFQKYSIHIGLVFYMIMLPGLICFAISYHQLMQIADFREVDMLIQNSRIEYDGNYYACEGNDNNSNNNQYCGAYKASFQVQWGHEWACPKNPKVWCQEWIVEEDCVVLMENSTTTETEFAHNAKLVQDCILAKYQLPAIGVLDQKVYPELQEDDKWPEIPWYGTCSSRCQTEPLSTDMYQFAERVKLTGLVLSCSGAILFFVYYCIIFGKDMMDCCNIVCCNQSKKFRSMREEYGILRLFASSSDREAPVHNGRNNNNNAAARNDNDDDVSDAFSIPPEIIQEEMEEMRELERSRLQNQTTTTSSGPPVMVEASILYSSDDDDDDSEDYSDDDDDDDGDEEYGSSDGDANLSVDDSDDDDNDDQDDEESSNSRYESSLDEIDVVSVDPSLLCNLDEESTSSSSASASASLENNISVDINTKNNSKTTRVDEVEIDV